MKATRYKFNGKVYSSLDEMPPEVRAFFEDKDGDGLPDGIGGNIGKDTTISRAVTTTTRYACNGVEYDRLDDMPPDIRALFEDRDGDGRPDLLRAMESMAKSGSGKRAAKSAHALEPAERVSPPPVKHIARDDNYERNVSMGKDPGIRKKGKEYEPRQGKPGKRGFLARLFGKK